MTNDEFAGRVGCVLIAIFFIGLNVISGVMLAVAFLGSRP